MDVLSYYPPAESRYYEVEGGGEVDRDGEDSKIAVSKISIKTEIGLKGLIEAGIKYIFDHNRNGVLSTDVDTHLAVTNNGYRSATLNTSAYSAAINTGGYSVAINTGSHSIATNKGYGFISASTGSYSAVMNKGDCSAVINTGYCSVAMDTGDCSTAVSMGDCSTASVKGEKVLLVD